MLRELQPIAERIIFCGVDSPRAASPGELAANFLSEEISGVIAEDVCVALELAKAEGARHLLVTGSLFLVGETLAHLDKVTHERSSQ